VKRDAFGFVNVESFSKYRFPKITQPEPGLGKTLYVTSSEENPPSGVNPLRVFNKLDGTPVLKAFTL
jgi:hypothetical protein